MISNHLYSQFFLIYAIINVERYILCFSPQRTVSVIFTDITNNCQKDPNTFTQLPWTSSAPNHVYVSLGETRR